MRVILCLVILYAVMHWTGLLKAYDAWMDSKPALVRWSISLGLLALVALDFYVDFH